MTRYKGLSLLLIFLTPILLCLPSPSVHALTIDIDTTIPEYILDDNITLDGSVRDTTVTINDDTGGEFNIGTRINVTVDSNTLYLRPDLDFTIQNNGNDILTKGGASAWDNALRHMCALKVNSTYYIYYAAGSDWRAAAIGLAKSTDGTTWTKHASNPVFPRSGGDRSYAQPFVYHENGTFYMYYSRWMGVNNGWELCMATSNDGVNWTKNANNPIIDNTAKISAWNFSIKMGCILKDGDIYRMYFTGNQQSGSGGIAYMGQATSKDLKSWTEDPNNPGRKGDTSSWEEKRTHYRTIENVSGSYSLWSCSGYNNPTKWPIGWLRSDDADAMTFVDSGRSVLLLKANTLYEDGFPAFSVIDEGTHYLMFASCFDSNWKFRYALFKIEPTGLDGTYTSKVFDATGRVHLTDMSWKKNVTEGGSIDLSFRWSNDSVTWSSWTPVTSSFKPLGTVARYFQYMADFEVPVDWNRIRLERFSFTYHASIDTMEVQVDGGPWQEVPLVAGSWTVNVDLQEGDYDILLRGFDNQGIPVVTRTLPVKVDLTAPYGSVLIEGGDKFSNSNRLHFTMTATDTHGVGEFMVSASPDLADGQWIPFFPHSVYDHPGPDGEVKLYVKFRDMAGRESIVYNDSITVDTTPPNGTITINGGVNYTHDRQVTLDMNWSDTTGVVAIKVSNDPNFVGVDWRTPVQTLDWELEDADGPQRVYLRLRDAVGWTIDLVDDIRLDTTPPTARVVIDDGATYTSTGIVQVEVSMNDLAPFAFKLRQADVDWPSEWATNVPSGPFPLPLTAGPDGERWIELLVMDVAGNQVQVSDGIVLDTTPPQVQLVLDGGASRTRDVLVRATMDASDATSGLDRMRMGNVEDLTGELWVAIKSSLDWTLLAGDGTKTVTVEVRDVARNIASFSASIVLDATAPSGSVRIGEGEEYMTDPSVTLFLDFADDFGLADMRASNDPLFTQFEWTGYENILSWQLIAVEGDQWVYVEVRDEAGNSFVATASTILDLADPQVSVIIADGAEATLEGTVDVAWHASDHMGLDALRVSMDPSFAQVIWIPFVGLPWETNGTLTVSIEGADGMRSVHVQVRDVAGRVSTAVDTIYYVSSRPEGAIVIGDGSGWTDSTDIQVVVSWTGGPEATHARVATDEDLLDSADWLPIGQAHVLVLPLEDGTQVVYAQLREAHFITSSPFAGEVILDTRPPVLLITGMLPPQVVEGRHVVNVTASDALSADITTEWRLDDGPWAPVVGNSFDVKLEAGDHTVEVRAIDIAGNEAVAPWDVVVTAKVEPSGSAWPIVFAIVAAIAVICAIGLWMLEKRRKEKDEWVEMDGGGPS